MKINLFAVLSLGALAACAPPPPANPMEAQTRRAAAAEFAGRNCAAHAGGYAAVQQMREDSNRTAATARNLGATDADFDAARNTVATTFNTVAAFSSHQAACNELVGSLAWAVGG